MSFFRLTLFIPLILTTLLAQTEKAQLTGNVTDSSQASVAGVQVVAFSTVTGARRTVTTNEQGLYSIPFLDPGIYDVQVQKDGFRTLQRSGVKLDVAQTATLNFSLERGLRRRRIELSVTHGVQAEVCCERTRPQLRPFLHWCVCPNLSMVPGRRLNIGEAPGALP